MRRALLAVSLILLAPWRVQAAPPSADTAQLTRIETITEQIRGLKPTHNVIARFPSDSSFNAVLKSELQRDNPDSELEISQRESVLLGLLRPGQDLKQIYFNGLANPASVVGLYDYKTSTLYVRNQSKQAFGLDRYVIAHEFTHALQDQHWHLQKLMPDQNQLTYRNSDAVSAHHALTEGDAVNLQYLFISREYSAQEIQALYKEASQNPAAPLPKALQREFYFPYDAGYSFVRALYDHAGMRAVDAAYARLPASTYEILHPSAYLQHWRPVQVAFHGIQGYSDWKQVDDDVLGALGYKVLIWQYSSSKLAGSAIWGYRGDRYVFLENGTKDAIVMRSVWSSASTATTARKAIATSLKSRYPTGRWTNAGTTFTFTNGAAYLTSHGKSMVLVLAPTSDIARGMATAPTT